MLTAFLVHVVALLIFECCCGWDKRRDKGDGKDNFGFPVAPKAKVCHFLLYTFVLSIIFLIALGMQPGISVRRGVMAAYKIVSLGVPVRIRSLFPEFQESGGK